MKILLTLILFLSFLPASVEAFPTPCAQVEGYVKEMRAVGAQVKADYPAVLSAGSALETSPYLIVSALSEELAGLEVISPPGVFLSYHLAYEKRLQVFISAAKEAEIKGNVAYFLYFDQINAAREKFNAEAARLSRLCPLFPVQTG